MHSSTILSLLITPALSLTTSHFTKRDSSCDEPTSLLCFGIGNLGAPQHINKSDIEYAASALRHIASSDNNPLWTMPPEDPSTCSEWTIPVTNSKGTLLLLAKHISPGTYSSVTYNDLARTIDGGKDATDEEKKDSILGACGENGGMKGVVVDSGDEVYHSEEYVNSGAKPEGIVVKLVHAPES